MQVTEEIKSKQKIYRINQSEYELICDLLGHAPEGIEWALFSALWSEHCSYKSSRVHLKKLYNQSPRVLQAFGENAGVVDLGQGERVAFKMESHNHPSFIEPYQGAATGVGGILRDIFTMGARPIAIANYLCFGEPDAERMSTLVDGVVRGIGGYGNCVGVPNVTGQTEFDASYNGNILVNAFALGYFAPGVPIALSGAKGPGNLVVYVGAKTGRDGVHGASMASESFDDDTESKKPNVQIGDPFFEKCLIESCIEVIEADLVEAIQDMGAAGLTSSSFEMASKGQVGLRLNLDQVPVRDSLITPEEIPLSESQERMLLVCLPEKFAELQKVFHRWDLDATVVGEVLAERIVEINWHGEILTSIDPDLLVENAPAYKRPFYKWNPTNRVESLAAKDSVSLKDQLSSDLSSIAGTSREWVYQQYDQRVGGGTERGCVDTVGVVRLPVSKRRLGIVLGCRPHLMKLDAFVGGIDSVAYPSLQLAALGFEPIAMTDCLNFGNPEKEKVMSEFVAALDGMNQMARAVQTPIISGNVSFYNETLGENITSTPSTGIVGLREDKGPMADDKFNQSGQDILLIRLAGLESSGDKISGEINIEKTADFIGKILEFSLKFSPSAAKVVGKFGAEYTLAKMTLSGVGAEVCSMGELGRQRFYEVMFSIANFASIKNQIEELFADYEVMRLGQTGGKELKIENQSMAIDEIECLYKSGWEKSFNELA